MKNYLGNLKDKNMNKIDLLWNYQSEQRQIGQSMDQQRIAISNFIITLTVGLVAVISVQGINNNYLIIIATLITLLGIYGILTTLKFYERSHFHFNRSRQCLEKIDNLLNEKVLLEIKKTTLKKHSKNFNTIFKIHNYQIWLLLHIIISLFGLTLLAIVLFI